MPSPQQIDEAMIGGLIPRPGWPGAAEKTKGLLLLAENSPQLLPGVQVLDQIVKVATTAAWSDAGSDFGSVGTSFTDGKRPGATTVRTSDP